MKKSTQKKQIHFPEGLTIVENITEIKLQQPLARVLKSSSPIWVRQQEVFKKRKLRNVKYLVDPEEDPGLSEVSFVPESFTVWWRFYY